MGLGVDLPAVSLGIGSDIRLFDISTVGDAVASGVVQRTYATGRQRAITGFASRSRLSLTAEMVNAEAWDWLEGRIGGRLLYRHPNGYLNPVVLGDIARNVEAAKSDDTAWGAFIDLFLAGEES